MSNIKILQPLNREPGTAHFRYKFIVNLPIDKDMGMIVLYNIGRVLSVLILFLTMVSCSNGDDVRAIRALIKEGANLAEERKIGALMKLTTDDFVALPGELDRRGTKGILWRAFNYYKTFKILYPRPDVDLGAEGSVSTATFPFLIVKKEPAFGDLKDLYEEPQRWLEEVGKSADLYSLKLELTKNGGDWLVRSATLKKFTGYSFRE